MIDNRLPPNDIDAEICLLGALLLCTDTETRKRICKEVRQDDFMDSYDALGEHGRLFAAIKKRVDAGKGVDPTLIRSDLMDGGLEGQKANEFLGEVLDSVPNALNIDEYAAKVRAKSDTRRALAVHERAMRRLWQNVDVADSISTTVNELGEIRQRSNRLRGRTIEDITGEAFERLGKGETNFLPSCLPSVQTILGGYKFKRNHICAALPSVGKSTLNRQELIAWAIQGVKVGLVTLEEPEDMIAEKLLAAYGEVPNHRIASGKLNKEDWPKLANGLTMVATENMVVVEPSIMLDDVVAAIELLVHKYGCRAVCVDHFHLVRTRDRVGDIEMQTQISSILKYKYRELDVVGMTVAQLNKASYGRECRVPSRGDLRGSGMLDADADAVILLHREDELNKGKPNYVNTNVAQFIVAKNKGGKCGDTGSMIRWNGDFQRYEEWGHTYDPFSN